MNCLNSSIGQQFIVIAVGFGNAQRLGSTSRFFGRGA
jgi:hypothetical protein